MRASIVIGLEGCSAFSISARSVCVSALGSNESFPFKHLCHLLMWDNGEWCVKELMKRCPWRIDTNRFSKTYPDCNLRHNRAWAHCCCVSPLHSLSISPISSLLASLSPIHYCLSRSNPLSLIATSFATAGRLVEANTTTVLSHSLPSQATPVTTHQHTSISVAATLHHLTFEALRLSMPTQFSNIPTSHHQFRDNLFEPQHQRSHEPSPVFMNTLNLS